MSHLPNIREAVAHVDEVAVKRVIRYRLWALAGSAAILAAAYYGADRIMPVAGPYLPLLDVVPGFKALPDALTGEFCQPVQATGRLVFGMFLVFIPLSWLLYAARVGPRYLKAVRKVAESVVPSADRADRRNHAVTIDFGWSRDRYRYPDPGLAGLYFIASLAAVIDGLLFAHLIGAGCAAPPVSLVYLAIEVAFAGLLAITAPHAVVLMLQARLLRRGPRR